MIFRLAFAIPRRSMVGHGAQQKLSNTMIPVEA
jgi:hypothetical protein